MDSARAEIYGEGLRQAQIDRLLRAGVTIQTLMWPTLVTATRGQRGQDGRFDYDPRQRPDWLAFEEDEDFVFCPFRQLADDEPPFATVMGRSFALGEANIDNAGTYCFDGWLSVWPTPLAWLKAGRRGIVIVDWSRMFDRLRDAPRILGETVRLAEKIDTLMHPARLPVIGAKVAKRADQKRRL